jgi:thiamine-monophosphate kinase
MGEFDFIARLAQRVRVTSEVVLGIGDDAALLAVEAGYEQVVAVDTLVAGVHFPLDADPADIGHKLAAVNLSDLAAMGAEPRHALLALTLPALDPGWLEPFLDGLLALLGQHAVTLVGGDTTRGPATLTLTLLGRVPAGQALRRSGARAGDWVCVSGWLGDAAAALSLRGTPYPPAGAARLVRERLDQRLARPTPRVALGLALRGIASACIDVSDGLYADLGHLARASGLAAVVDPARLPTSRALRTAIADPAQLQRLQGGGDDYELCFTLPREREAALAELARQAHVPLTVIGEMGPGEGVYRLESDGSVRPAGHGWDHFA